jgi:hypothetical protein
LEDDAVVDNGKRKRSGDEDPKTTQRLCKHRSQKEPQGTAGSEADASPASKKLLDMQKDLERMLEYRRAEKALKEKYFGS